MSWQVLDWVQRQSIKNQSALVKRHTTNAGVVGGPQTNDRAMWNTQEKAKEQQKKTVL